MSKDEKDDECVPYVNIPALKIARLAIDKKAQSKSLGKEFINFAVFISLKARELFGIKFITVDCYKHRLSYYKKYGFKENTKINEGKDGDNPISLRLNIDDYLENIEL